MKRNIVIKTFSFICFFIYIFFSIANIIIIIIIILSITSFNPLLSRILRDRNFSSCISVAVIPNSDISIWLKLLK